MRHLRFYMGMIQKVRGQRAAWKIHGESGKAPVLGSETRPAALEAMMNAIHHGGPDDGRMYLDDGAALGFRRLAIIDTAGSAQPMKNETGSIVLVFNGEIYNYQELREELLSLGHQFRTKGDSEVLLHGYEEWKENLPERLRGCLLLRSGMPAGKSFFWPGIILASNHCTMR